MRAQHPTLMIDITVRTRMVLKDAAAEGRSILDLAPESDVAGWFRALAEVVSRAAA